MPWIIPLLTTGYSIYQSASSASKAKKAENALEESLKNTPQYKPNQSILDYYQTALNKYNTNPTDTREYKATQQGIKQGTVQGLKYLQDRRSGMAGVPSLIAGQNNALLNAAVKSEQRKDAELSRVGQAAGMKAAEEGKAFQQNKIYPFEGRYNLLAMKAAGERANQRVASQNAYNNLSAAGSLVPDLPTQAEKFAMRYKDQAGEAYNWAKVNNMNFGQYRRQGNRVGRSLMNYGF